MKKITTLIAILFTGMIYAQCPTAPCISTVQMNGAVLANTSFNGSTCFKGPGTISSSVNINNAPFLSFDSLITVAQSLNLQTNQKIYARKGVSLTHVSLAGGDTLYVRDTLNIHIIISNNSTPGNYNVISLAQNAAVKILGHVYTAGDTVFTATNGNTITPATLIYVVSCEMNVPLHTGIKSFTRAFDYLFWQVDYPAGVTTTELQHSTDSNTFTAVHTTSASEDNYLIKAPGFYRLRLGNEYSNIIPVQDQAPATTCKDSNIYNVLGQRVNNPQPNGVYFQCGKRLPVLLK